jgi:hypothetical protein
MGVKFIEMHDLLGQTVLVNPELVVLVRPSNDNSGKATIVFGDACFQVVEESITDVEKKLQETQ